MPSQLIDPIRGTARSPAAIDFGPAQIARDRMLDPQHLGDHLDRLFRAAWALCGSREEAEDLVQDTYLRVLARPRFLRREEDLAYLLRALRNTFLAGRRSLRARSVHVPLEEDIERPSGVGPEEALEQR